MINNTLVHLERRSYVQNSKLSLWDTSHISSRQILTAVFWWTVLRPPLPSSTSCCQSVMTIMCSIGYCLWVSTGTSHLETTSNYSQISVWNMSLSLKTESGRSALLLRIVLKPWLQTEKQRFTQTPILSQTFCPSLSTPVLPHSKNTSRVRISYISVKTSKHNVHNKEGSTAL